MCLLYLKALICIPVNNWHSLFCLNFILDFIITPYHSNIYTTYIKGILLIHNKIQILLFLVLSFNLLNVIFLVYLCVDPAGSNALVLAVDEVMEVAVGPAHHANAVTLSKLVQVELTVLSPAKNSHELKSGQLFFY